MINALGVGVAQGEGGGGKGGRDFSTDLRGGVLRGDVGHLPLLLRPLQVLLRGPKVPKVHLLKPWKPPYVLCLHDLVSVIKFFCDLLQVAACNVMLGVDFGDQSQTPD